MTSFRDRVFIPALMFVGAVNAIISSLGAPLLPQIARDLDASISNTQWALTSTIVVAAIASPLVGRMGDGRHRRLVVAACLGSVVVGCVMAALATSLGPLIFGRALQGLGMAIMPLTMAAARDHMPAAQARNVIAGLSVVGAAGVGLGYPITGLVADHGGVAAAYWLGAGVSAVSLALGLWVISPPDDDRRMMNLDVLGAFIVAVGLVLVLIPLDKAVDWGWTSLPVVLMLAGGVVSLALWAFHELRTRDPLVDLRLLRHRAVLTANFAGLLMGLTMYILMVVIVQFVQLDSFGLGETIFIAGLTLVPMSVLSGVMSFALPRLQSRFSIRAVMSSGAISVALGALLFGLTATALWQVLVCMALVGIGIGTTFAALPGLIVLAVPAEETGSAMGFYQVSRFFGFALGSGLAVTLLRAFGEAGEPTLHSYKSTALMIVGLGVVTALVTWFLPGRPTAAPTPSEVDRYQVEDGLLASAGLEDGER